ncbi:MAG: M4 family metallopeptidase [Chitinispirillaceae bacterium]|nr:M4 family metallopeptidase [Chitinispirillaceae bacterium]
MKTLLHPRCFMPLATVMVLIMFSVQAVSEKQIGSQSLTSYGFSNIKYDEGLVNAKRVVPVKDLNTQLLADLGQKGISDFKSASVDVVKQTVAQSFNNAHGTVRSEFRLRRIHTDEAKNRHFIFDQFIDDIQVLGSTVAIHVHPEGELYEVTGSFLSGNEPSTSPVIDDTVAVNAAKKILKEDSKPKRASKLVIVGGRVAYQIYMDEPGTFGAWNMLIDAKTGEVLQKITTVSHYSTPPDYPDGNLVDMLGYRLEREKGDEVSFRGWNAANGNHYLFNDSAHWQVLTGGEIAWNNTSDWGTANRPLMSLAKNLSLIQKFVFDSMGWNSFDNEGAMLVCNYTGGLNAGWNGPSLLMTIGSGDGVISNEWAALEMVGHEFGHAITEYATGLNTGGFEDAALNEAYSDILGSCIEQWAQNDLRAAYPAIVDGVADWLNGEDVFLDSSRTPPDNKWWGRNLRSPYLDPGFDGPCPSIIYGSARCWTPPPLLQFDIHINSTPISHSFYLMSEGAPAATNNIIDETPLYFSIDYGPFPGLGINTARRVAWGAQFNGRIVYNSGYSDARNAWVATAKDLGHNAGTVAQALIAVGVIDRTVNSDLPGNGEPNPLLPGNTQGYPGTPTIPNYTSITQALTNSNPGDLIYVYPGTYPENLTISTADITLAGQNWDVTNLQGTITIDSDGSGFTLAGFNVNGLGAANGISIDNATMVAICNNKITNSQTGILSNVRCQIIGNSFFNCSNQSLTIQYAGQSVVKDNDFQNKGMTLDGCMFGTIVSGNRLDGIGGSGIFINGGAWQYVVYNLFQGISSYTVTGETNSPQITGNVFNSTYAVPFNLGGSHYGSIYTNSFIGASYNVSSVPSDFYWDNESQGNFWIDYFPGAPIPFKGKDNYPLANRLVSPFIITSGTDVRMITNVNGENVKITGMVNNELMPIPGLQFGSKASLSAEGTLWCSQFLPGSDKWLDTPGNLNGCLVWTNAAGQPVIAVSPDGAFRTRGQLTPEM